MRYHDTIKQAINGYKKSLAKEWEKNGWTIVPVNEGETDSVFNHIDWNMCRELGEANNIIDNKHLQIQEQDKLISENKTRIEQQKNDIVKNDSIIRHQENDISLYDEQLTDMRKRWDKGLENIKSLNPEIEKQMSQIAKNKETIAAQNTTIKANNDIIKSHEQENNTLKQEADKYTNVINEGRECENKLPTLRNDVNSLEKKKTLLEKEVISRENKKRQYNDFFNKYDDEYKEKTKIIQDLSTKAAKYNELNSLLPGLQLAHDRLIRENDMLTNENNRLRNENDMLTKI